MDSWHSYPSIFAVGHKACRPLLEYDEVQVEEKLDGSQFSFGTFAGELRMKSKNAPILPGYIPALFAEACATVAALQPILPDGYTFRAEAICKPKHNVLQYNRIPHGGLVIFDINTGHDEYMSYSEKAELAKRLGLEVVPLLYTGRLHLTVMQELLQRESFLGGPKIEGVVIKPVKYDLYGTDKKVLMGKYVSDDFKEAHRTEWSASNPSGKSFLDLVIADYRTTARWDKTIQHLRDDNKLENTPKDIGILLKELSDDIDREVYDDVKERLIKHFWKDIKRGIMRGFPEHYKGRLLAEAFTPEEKKEC